MTEQDLQEIKDAMKQPPRTAYDLGYEAGRLHHSYLSCPLVGKAAREWQRGWEDGWNSRTLVRA